MSKRLAFLEQLVQSEKADSFARYGLAMEYRTLGRKDDARAAFEALRAVDATYVPMYLMAAQLASEQGDNTNAKSWAEEGVKVAKQKRDDHALSELESFLEGLPS